MPTEQQKSDVFSDVRKTLEAQNFQIVSEDQSRPWGGFFVLAEEQAQKFADKYFNGIAVDDLKISGKLSPKILIVAPEMRLSWQYHHRRAEIWQVMKGTVGIKTSDTDEEGEVKSYAEGDRIILQKGERHRLIGLKDWGIVAEIWQHTDPSNPSDESDIVRVQDDFGR
ncbi:cupin domain-containing protein [Daejeonella lutea]|uniref:Mannose-6-phosphate isomerase, cupin superfamily n=1 Tax=Daejeonella lutea TaxID=572036 RepID=A0A1T5ERM8_9SPHI|nr:phosphoheptose isomerase [Daejeonella lutea]SKB86498.1 Mannose-6-phosphate isomerase, cupin superfamily [Daejeonella lutea]